MGNCCQKLDTIDHVNTLDDLKYIIKIDIEMFLKQQKVLTEDKVIIIFNSYL